MTFFSKHLATSAVIKLKPRGFLREYLDIFFTSFDLKYFSELILGKTESRYLLTFLLCCEIILLRG